MTRAARTWLVAAIWLGGCSPSPAGPAGPPRPVEPVASAPTSIAPESAAASLSSPPPPTPSPPPDVSPSASLPRIAKELGARTWAAITPPFEIDGRALKTAGFVDPKTEDLGEARVSGFPVVRSWGAPKNADFAQKLAAILQTDASYDFDVVTRCKPSKGVLGLVLRHRPVCGPTDSCAVEVVHVAVNFPCHQIFVTSSEISDGKAHGKAWGAHIGPSKDRWLDLLVEGFPDQATFLRSLR